MLASNVILGSGSGTITQSGNPAGLNPGDTIFIQTSAPSYSSISITNLVGSPNTGIIVILPLDWKTGGQIYMTGQFTLSGKYYDFSRLNASGFTSTPVLNMTGKSSHFYVHDCMATSCQDFIDANTNLSGTYTDTSTYKWYYGRFNNITIDSCYYLAVLSYGSVVDVPPKDIMDSVVFTNITITRTKSNGTETFGIVFRCDMHNWTINTSYRLLNGDVGAMLISGNGQFYNIRKDGGVGYEGRLILYTMAVDTSVTPTSYTYVYNSGQYNTSDYGMWDIKNDSTQWKNTTHIKGGNLIGRFLTGSNLKNTISYWSYPWVLGDFYAGQSVSIKYTIAANLVLSGKPNGVMIFQGLTSGVTIDTSNNYYQNYITAYLLDSTGTFPTLKPLPGSWVIGRASSVNFVTTDYYGVTRPTSPSLGFAEPQPPANPCNCVPHNSSNSNIYQKSSKIDGIKAKQYYIKEKKILYA